MPSVKLSSEDVSVPLRRSAVVIAKYRTMLRRYTWVIHDVAFKPLVCELNVIWPSVLTGRRRLGTDGDTHSDQNDIN
jgi:hypothetical protein